MSDDIAGNLQEIGMKFGSDKFTVHKFGPVYERYFAEFRDKPIKLLEIGIGGEENEIGGMSLKTWEAYFPKAQITGIDIYNKSELDNDRISTFVCDQSNQKELYALSEEFGPFDLIIDDGSHRSEPTLRSLFGLFHLLKPGGYYVIEDIQTSYWPHYGGTSVLSDIMNTPVYWIKRMIDVINQDEILWESHPAKISGFVASELHVHHNIAFIKRALTPEKSSVINEQLRTEWLEEDYRTHQITEDIAKRLSDDPEFRNKLIEFLSVLRK